MLQKIMISQKPLQRFIFKFIVFIFVCLATFGFLLCCAAFVIVKVDTPEYVLVPLTTALLAFSSFIDSILLAKLFKENGMAIGLCVAVIFICLVVGSAVWFKTFTMSSLLFTKMLAVIAAGAIGGILGVNL